MAKLAKKAKPVSPRSSQAQTKPSKPTKPPRKAPAKKPVKPAPKLAGKPAPKKPASHAPRLPIKASPVKLPAKATTSKTLPVKPSPAKPVVASAPAAKAKSASPAAQPPKPVAGKSVAPVATPPGKSVAPPKLVSGTKPVGGAKPAPGAKPAASTSKKGKKGQPTGPVVISAKPGQILLTPLKPTNPTGLPIKPVLTAVAPTAPEPKKKAAPVPVPLPPPPVTSDSKAKKNQAGLSAKELEFYRGLLLAKRREIVGDMSSMEREALRGAGGTLSNLPIHMADMGTDNYEQEFTLGLVEKDRALLREVNLAIAKIHNGTYGICEGTAKPISKARLEAQPWSKFSIEYVRTLELRNFRR